MSDDLDAWITEQAKHVWAACRLTRECGDSIIARAMRDAVDEARRIDAAERRVEAQLEDRS